LIILSAATRLSEIIRIAPSLHCPPIRCGLPFCLMELADLFAVCPLKSRREEFSVRFLQYFSFFFFVFSNCRISFPKLIKVSELLSSEPRKFCGWPVRCFLAVGGLLAALPIGQRIPPLPELHSLLLTMAWVSSPVGKVIESARGGQPKEKDSSAFPYHSCVATSAARRTSP